MSRSRGKLHKAQCCPWCGTRTIVRDGFNPASHTDYNCVSYICVLCNAGFSLRDSPRAQYVNRMYAEERARQPPTAEHVFARRGGSPPLTERSLHELQRLDEVLRSKHPRSKTSREANAEQLKNVRAELNRRQVRAGALTYKIADVFPPGCLPEPYGQISGENETG